MILSSATALKAAPRRIVSLVPSQTEFLAYLGLDTQTIGITKFCVHPENWRKTRSIIGGTKNVQVEKIKGLQPDLIIANKEENVREQVEELARYFPVWVTDVNDLPGAMSMIKDIGTLTGTLPAAISLTEKISREFQQIQTLSTRANTAYLIWKDPYMTIGGDTFIHDMLNRCGLNNIFKAQARYPSLQLEELVDKACQLCLLSTEPYPFTTHHLQALQQEFPQVTFKLVNGEFFSWYGSRLLDAPRYFNHLLNSIRLPAQTHH